ncbi:putative nuclease HARBI1 [Mycetomoellerius zeteki]|uniref:putative nuclease HARBI1 n=1 Tax=Mycetomoellerius zeteki TaxID=64791 RepID=UPI00084E8C8B|nr:PREDICTED: putative nuclease HARBI1 [Trachymyrmex zeteki]
MDLLHLILIAADDADDVRGIELQRNIINFIAKELDEPLRNNLLQNERRMRSKNEHYYEVIVPRYNDYVFKEHFRMSRVTFENLVHIIGHAMHSNHNNPVDLRKKVMFTIWILAKQESYLSAGDRFNLAKSTAHGIVKEITNILVDLLPNYVRWPDAGMCEIISMVFKRRSHGIPGVVGIIDGCHIPCKAPIDNPNDFYNRKGFHSIVLQGVCDHKGRFIDIFVGLPGRMHDARVFRQSEIFQRLKHHLLPPDRHIIGDAAYPLLVNLLTPYRDTGHLTRTQIIYNTNLSTIRSMIERGYSFLKGKFRRLKYLDIADFDFGNKMIAAACVLHNFLIDHNETNYEDDEELLEEEQEEVAVEREVADNNEAIIKRNRIAESLIRNN